MTARVPGEMRATTPGPDAGDASDASDAEAGPPPCIDVYDPNTIPKFELTVDAAGMAVLASTAEADKKKRSFRPRRPTAPRSRYGIYANIETPNEQLLDRLFGASASTLYEVQYGSEWLPGLEDGADVQVGDDARADLTALYTAVQNASSATLLADVAGKLDTAAWLQHSAAEAAVGHYDGYAFGIDALVAADPKREPTLAEYASETQLLHAWIAARPGVVRAQLGLP